MLKRILKVITTAAFLGVQTVSDFGVNVVNSVIGLFHRASVRSSDNNTSFMRKACDFVITTSIKEMIVLATAFVLTFCLDGLQGNLTYGKSLVTSAFDAPKFLTNFVQRLVPKWLT